MKRNVVAAISLIGLGVLLGILLVTNFSPNSISKMFGAEIGAKNPPVQVNQYAKALNDAVVAVSNAVNPTVVSISVEIESKGGPNPFRDQWKDFFKFFGGPDNGDDNDNQPRRSEASGSGVIVSDNGYIITNNHVIENAMKDGITVTTFDKKVYKKAKLIGRDPQTDLAVIKIDADNLPAVHFAEISDIKVGDIVLAIGNPLGLNSTVTMGIISAIGRGQLNLMNRDRYSVENFIQTDAAINPGNSGGGLFDLGGSLVGINAAIATQTGSYIGYGFAIPVDIVKKVATDLIENGKVNRGYIGVTIKTVDEVDAKAAHLEKIQGALVNDINKGSAGDKAGLERGDIILEVDGKPVSSSNELQSLVTLHKAGDIVKLTIWRDSKKIYKDIKLQPRTDETDVSENSGNDQENSPESNGPVSFKSLGFSVQPITSDIKDNYDVKHGVMVTKVERYSEASDRGLAPNGVIVKADKKDIKSPDDLEKIIKAKKPGEALMLQVKYKDNYQIIALEIPES